MMADPLVTIGITCFNAEATIKRAVTSALEQSWENLEIIIVDDCSTDRSANILEEIERTNKNIELIVHEDNLGPAAARDTILGKARGDFLAFFDDDDESDPDRIGTQYKRIMEYEKNSKEKIVVCYASGQRVYANGYIVNIEAIGSKDIVPKGEDVSNYILFNKRSFGVFYGAGTPTCSMMARTEILRNIGGFDKSFRRVEDMELAVRLARGGGHFIGCKEKLYTQYATFAEDKNPLSNYKAELKLLEKNRDYLEARNRYDYARNWFRVRYYHFERKHFRALLALFVAWLKHPYLVTRHFLASVPKRMIHEYRMNKKQDRAT